MVPLSKEDINSEVTKIQEALQAYFGRDVFIGWLSKLQLVSISDYELVMSVPTVFIRDWITREYLDGVQKRIDNKKVWVKKGIRQILTELYPKLASIDIIVDRSQKIGVSEEIEKKDNNQKFEISNNSHSSNVYSFSQNNNLYNVGIELNEKYTFENFVVGKSNQLAYSVAKEIGNEDKFNPETNPLFLYGGVGLGKTHLCQAIAWKLKDKFPDKILMYLTAEKFMYLFVQSLQNQDVNFFKNKFRNIDILIIDDIHFIAGKESTQKEFFQTFNSLLSENKQIILACDKSPLNLEKVDEQLKSRMSGGMVIDVHDPDYDLRFDLVKFKSNQIGLNLDLKCQKFIAENLATNCREIEGCLKRLLVHQKFVQSNIDQVTIEEILQVNLEKTKKIVTIDEIQETVCGYFGITMANLKSEKRLKELVIPRHVAMYLSKQLTQKSFPDIAKKFGGKNHATVIHAINKISKDINTDPELNEIILKIKNNLNK